MENVVLTVHLILAALLIGVVLLQRSEGGGLGMGSTGGVMTGRQAANALTKATWILAIGFLITSISLTVLAARNAGAGSVIDRIDPSAPAAPAPATPTGNLPAYTPPPPAATGQPVLPPTPATPAGEAPAPTAPATNAPATPAAPATN